MVGWLSVVVVVCGCCMLVGWLVVVDAGVVCCWVLVVDGGACVGVVGVGR